MRTQEIFLGIQFRDFNIDPTEDQKLFESKTYIFISQVTFAK